MAHWKAKRKTRWVPVMLVGLMLIPSRGGCVRPAEPLDGPDHLARLVLPLLELDAGVEVLGVLADHHQVDVLVAAAHARVPLGGTHQREEVELAAQRHVDAADAVCRSEWSAAP